MLHVGEIPTKEQIIPTIVKINRVRRTVGVRLILLGFGAVS